MRPPAEILKALLAGEKLADGEADALLAALDSDEAFREAAGDELFAHGLLTALHAREARRSRRPRRGRRGALWLIGSVAAAAVVVAAAWLGLGRPYPEPAASGGFEVAGGGAVGRGSVLTAGRAGAEVSLGGYCRVAMAPGSEMKIAGSPRAEAVKLARGSATCEVDRSVGSFQVVTDAGTVSVTGTKFTVRVIEEEGMLSKRMYVKVLAGAVVLTGAWGEVQLAKGREATLPRRGAGRVTKAGVVSNVKVVSDGVPDMSSLDAWRKWCIKPGMTDREKALAIWRTVAGHQHQDAPPNEFLQNENNVLDAFKIFNVYGYSYCGVASSHVEAMARGIGLEARGWTINRHVVSEVKWAGKWHLLDASLVCHFPNDSGDVASVKEISAAVADWYAKNPGYKGNHKKLTDLHRQNGWTGWRGGPPMLTKCEFYDKGGWLPARTHGWYSTMEEYDGSTLFPYEQGYSLGYRVNVQLRKGERLTRNWHNKGLHVNMDGTGGAPGCMKDVRFLHNYSRRFGDVAPGRVGNGTLEYDVPLASGGFRGGALSADNLACRAEDRRSPALHLKNAARSGVLVIRMPSSYVYLGGEAALDAKVAAGGSVEVMFSDNNGLDWKSLATITEAGERKIDLKPHVYRRYDYRLKLVMKGKGTGLEALKITHDIQHSQRPLPALHKGKNTIAFSAEPQEGTVTVEGSTTPGNKARQLVVADFHPQMVNLKPQLLGPRNGPGSITLPVRTPGEMKRLRFGCYYRARDARDGWDLQVSFDGGRSFKTVDRAPGPAAFAGKYVTCEDIPAGTKEALVRYSSATWRNAVLIFDLRIDADYAEPSGGFSPVKVTYVWEENGQAKRHVHVARKANETYSITCAGEPLMKSLAVELAE